MHAPLGQQVLGNLRVDERAALHGVGKHMVVGQRGNGLMSFGVGLLVLRCPRPNGAAVEVVFVGSGTHIARLEGLLGDCQLVSSGKHLVRALDGQTLLPRDDEIRIGCG